MKYARMDIETIGYVNPNDKSFINYGDHLQNIIIKDIYKEMGISENEIYALNFNEISTYDGEYLILPINQAFTHNCATFISPKIIPVFLGLSRDVSAISEEEITYFRKYEPIGCRDEALFNRLRENQVDCYLNGCVSVLLNKRNANIENGKVFLIDIPNNALSSLPASFIQKSVTWSNISYGTYCEVVGEYDSMENLVRNRYEYLKENASLVITSRLHIAAPCIGMGIPVIIVKDYIDYRFSWIDKLIPIYKTSDVAKIKWDSYINVPDFELIKAAVLNNAKQRIKETYNKYALQKQICEFYEKREKVEYELPQYSQLGIDYAKNRWTPNEHFKYAMWGKNDASEMLYTYLKSNYPHAEYVAFYDTYKEISYHGIHSKKPTEIKANEDIFIFVTGYTAGLAAKELFKKINKSKDSYYIYE